MKWKNKGHEFEEYSEVFAPGTKVYIYGAGENGTDLFKRLGFADCVSGFIDNNTNAFPRKDGREYLGKPVYTIAEFTELEVPINHIVVMALSLNNIASTMPQMLLRNYKEGRNLFSYHSFVRFYLPLFAWYAYKKVYFDNICVLVTQTCNLDCKGCLNFHHLYETTAKRDIVDLKKWIDMVFSRIDMIGLLHMTGGEPLLFPEFIELVSYIREKYGDRIAILGTTTNGTIIPNSETIKAFKENMVTVWVDDYTDNVKLAKKNMSLVIDAFSEAGVDCRYNFVPEWWVLTSETELDDTEAMRINCEVCAAPFRSLKNGKIYACNYSEFASEAGVVQEEESDFIDLENSEAKGIIMTEYGMGFSEKGYSSYSKRCCGAGYTVNLKRIPVAEQYGK